MMILVFCLWTSFDIQTSFFLHLDSYIQTHTTLPTNQLDAKVYEYFFLEIF